MHTAQEYTILFPAGPHPCIITIANVVSLLSVAKSSRRVQCSGRSMNAGIIITSKSILACALIIYGS